MNLMGSVGCHDDAWLGRMFSGFNLGAIMFKSFVFTLDVITMSGHDGCLINSGMGVVGASEDTTRLH